MLAHPPVPCFTPDGDYPVRVYRQRFFSLTKVGTATVADHGGRYLAVAAAPEIVEGEPALTSAVLIEFPDLAAASGWYGSVEYRPLKALRRRSARNTAVLFVGVDAE